MPAHHPLQPPRVDEALRDLRPGRLKPKNGPAGRSLKNCERSARSALRRPSNTSIGSPPGLAAVFTISGGTAPIEDRFRERPCSAGAVAADVTSHLASAGGVADLDRVLQVERLDRARRGRRHTCPSRCHAMAGSTGRGRAGRARCSGSRATRRRSSGPPSRPSSAAIRVGQLGALPTRRCTVNRQGRTLHGSVTWL